MSSTAHHFAIAGAGLLGRLLAWRLLREGHRVSLFEKGSLEHPRAAAYTAAGMIAPLSEAAVADIHSYNMGMDALRLWPQWLEQLSQPVMYGHDGSIAVAHAQDQTELEQFSIDIQRVVGHTSGQQWLTSTQLQQLEPDLHHQFQQGLWLPEEAHIDNRGLLKALLTDIQTLDGNCFDNTSVELEPGRIIANNTSYRADTVIDCRGIGAKQPHSHWNSLRGVRGEVIRVQTREVTLTRPIRMMHPRYQLYIVPKPDHTYIIGATQIESEDQSPISLRSSLELNSALFSINPAFAEARIIEQDVNLRPAFMDNQPHVNIEDGLIRANGLFRHGYLLAPAVVEHIMARLPTNSSTTTATKIASQLPYGELLEATATNEMI